MRADPVPRKYKAGIIMVGDVDTPGGKKLYTVAPWIEGNFSDDKKKSYFLAKGTIDKEELDDAENGAKKAAVREFAEETGIYLDEIENDPRPPHLRKYVFDPFNPKHAGKPNSYFYNDRQVSVERWWDFQEPIFQDYIPSHRGNPSHHTMFAVKVNGIEKLAEHVKHRSSGHGEASVAIDQPDHVAVSAKEMAKQKTEEGGLPPFEVLLETLRTGHWRWGEKPEFVGRWFGEHFVEAEKSYLMSKAIAEQKMRIADLKFAVSGGEAQPEHFHRMLGIIDDFQRQMDDIKSGKMKITTPEQLEELYQNTNIQDVLKDDLRVIRKKMETMHIVSDQEGLKLDTKHHPLQYYQEGADVIPYDAWLSRMITFAEEHKKPDGSPGSFHNAQFNRFLDDRDAGKIYKGVHHSIADIIYHAGTEMDKASRGDASWKSATALENPAATKLKIDELYAALKKPVLGAEHSRT